MILMEGFLTKSPPKSLDDIIQLKRWKRRYFELKQLDDKPLLEYRKCKNTKAIKGIIDLNQLEYLVYNFPFIRQRRNLFAIKVNDKKTRIFYFNAKSINEFNDWIQALTSLLNMIPSIMDMNRAKELLLAGFLNKSYIKNEKEYCDMLVKSLFIVIPKTSVNTVSIQRHQCRRFSDDTYLNGEITLPTRCTSTLTSDSSSESASDDNENRIGITQQISDNINERYIDSTDLEFQTRNSRTANNELLNSEHIAYCSIDNPHTEALYQLNKRLGSS